MLCQYADKSCDHKHCDGGNMFLICQRIMCIYGCKLVKEAIILPCLMVTGLVKVEYKIFM